MLNGEVLVLNVGREEGLSIEGWRAVFCLRGGGGGDED